MKQTINDFINSIDTKLYSRIRASKGDAECRRYLKEHLAKQCDIHAVSHRSIEKCPHCGDENIDYLNYKKHLYGHCLNGGYKLIDKD